MAGAIPSTVALEPSHVSGARLYANRETALEALPQGGRVAEIGVAFGDFSDRMLEKLSPSHFDAYDIFRLHEVDVIWGQPSANTFQGRSHREYYEERFAKFVADGRMRVFEGDSSALLAEQPDAFYDVIYVDGDHTYEGVLRDARVAVEKLQPSGCLVFNDYIMADHTSNSPYGIVPVVNDLCVNHGWKVLYLALQPAMFCDICLVRAET